MVLIYDFDGTLTPYSLPRYPIIQKCGVELNDFYKRVLSHKDIYLGFCKEYENVLHSSKKKVSTENIIYGADKVNLNSGVVAFLDYFNQKNISQYIVTSGYEDYVKNTPVASFCQDIIGTAIDDKEQIIRLMSDAKKVDIIKDLITKYHLKTEDIIYFGDGLTDKEAFKYVHELGGKSILVYDFQNEKDLMALERLSKLGIIDQAFPKDFNLNSPMFQYINSFNMTR